MRSAEFPRVRPHKKSESMKVSINGKNAPRPFAAAGVGAAAAGVGIGAAGGLLGAGLNGLFSYRQQKRQMKHDKEMAAHNQRYALEQMAQANEYQVEQWNRENAYNDPAAVRARYEGAGLNARAAMGEGSASGAGIAGGLSSAPSGSGTGHSSNIMAAAPFGGLDDAIMQGARLGAQNEKDVADAQRAREEAKRVLLANEQTELEKAYGVWAANAEKKLDDAQLAKLRVEYQKYKNAQEQVVADYAAMNAEQDYQKRKAIAQQAFKNVEIAEQTLENLKSQGLLTDQEFETEKARTAVEWEKVKTQQAITDKERALVDVAKADAELKGEQARKITHDIIQGYISAGADAISCITDLVSMLSPILGISKAKRVANRVVTEQYDKDNKLVGKTIKIDDKIDGYTNISH